MSQPQSHPQTPSGEIVSNLFHAAIAVGFGLLTLASALHVAMTLT